MGILNAERKLTPSWDLLNPSIELVKKNIWQLFYLSFLPGVLLNIGLVVVRSKSFSLDNSHDSFFLWVFIAAIIWSLLAAPGLLYLQVSAARGKAVTTGEAFKTGLKRIFPLLGASILVGFITFLGFLAFIIPGLILVRAYFLTPYYVIDKKLGPIQAMKQSFHDTKPVSAWIWGVIGVDLTFAVGAGFLGIIPFIGVLLGSALALLYIFAPALRFLEVVGDKKALK
jgi:hypothetical protein